MSRPFFSWHFLTIHHGFHFSTKAGKNVMMNKCTPSERPTVKSKLNLIREPASQMVKPLRGYYTYKNALLTDF